MARRIGERSRIRERARQEVLIVRLAARYDRAMRQEIGQTMRKAASLLASQGESAASEVMPQHRRDVERIWTAGAVAGTELLARRSLDAAHDTEKLLHPWAWYRKDDSDDWRRVQERVAAYIAKWGAQKVTDITSTTEQQIRDILIRARDDGLGIDAAARALREQTSITAALRAHVIARTETHAAANYGAMAGAIESGVIMRREWIAVQDDRSREAHAEADGQTVAMDEPFDVGGEALMYPGDPAGSPENVIMCRCAVGMVVA